MNGRSGLVTFLLFMFLAVMILLQILSMIQSDRLYERLNVLLDRLETRTTTARVPQAKTTPTRADLPMEEYPGDEGDWLIWRLAAEPRTLNPITAEAEMSTRYITTGNIFERLLEYDPDEVKLEPWLAESYHVSDDGLEITIKLRDDIHFSDGVPITVDDILFTYETIMNPAIDAAVQRAFYNNFKEVLKIDERTVKFVCNEVYWKTFEAIGLFEVLPKHIYKFEDPQDFNMRRSNPVGSGPYTFEKWDVAQQVVLRRNENYWGHKPKTEKVIFRFISNDTAALQALRSEEVDYMYPTAEQFADMAGDEEFNEKFRAMSYWTPGVPYFYIAWNQEKPFFSDRLVRLAMTHMVDRNAIVEHLLRGSSKVTTGPFYIYGRQYDPAVEPWPYDLEKAAQLLDQAGWRDTDSDGVRDKQGVPFRFKLAFSTGRIFYEQFAKLLKDSAAKVGVDVIADPYEWSVFVERLQNHEFDALVVGAGGTVESDPYQHFHSSQIADRGDNVTSYSNPEVDALLDQARRTLDEDKRYPLYHRFHRLIHEEQPFTFLYIRPERVFLHRRFENVKTHKLGINSHEWYVPKKKQKYK
jgi:peptide/nickel transport system substrate-binding protein